MDSTFQNLRLSTTTGEQNYIKANPLYFAVGTQVCWFTSLIRIFKNHLLFTHFFIHSSNALAVNASQRVVEGRLLLFLSTSLVELNPRHP